MLLPRHLPTASFDQPPQIGVASPDWVLACLHRHPMTHHLLVRVRQEGDATVLEGQVPTRLDRHWAGSVATVAVRGKPLHNRLLVLDDLDGPLSSLEDGLEGRFEPLRAAA